MSFNVSKLVQNLDDGKPESPNTKCTDISTACQQYFKSSLFQ